MDRGSVSVSHLSSVPQSQPAARIPTPGTAAAPSDEILLVEEESSAASHALALRGSYRVATTISSDVAVQYITKGAPTLVVVDADAVGDGAKLICLTAKSASVPPTTLVTATRAEAVPGVLNAGCDAVLLKPFAPNLLYSRVGRLLRERADRLRARTRTPNGSNGSNGSEPLATTNHVWPETNCPACYRPGAVSFEFSSHRRAWYACLGCMAVWVGKRQE
jgi:CheY-like chemotaxis protein